MKQGYWTKEELAHFALTGNFPETHSQGEGRSVVDELSAHHREHLEKLKFRNIRNPPKQRKPQAYCKHKDGKDNLSYRSLLFNHDALQIQTIYLSSRPLSGTKGYDMASGLDKEETTVYETPDVDYQREACNRAKREIKRRIMHNYGPDMRFVTCTYREPCTDRIENIKNYQKMKLNYFKLYGTLLNVIGVMELHKDKIKYHWHFVLNNGRIDYDEFREKVWGLGAIYVSPVPEPSAHEKASNVADYLVKYIKKDMELVPKHQQRYFCAGTWEKDWSYSIGFGGPLVLTVDAILLYLRSMGVTYHKTRIEPYDGQVIHCITFDSGRFPLLDFSPFFTMTYDSRSCKEPPPKSLTLETVQLEFDHEV